jgi:hypothetical protein
MPFVEVDFSDLEFHETLGRGSAGSVYRGVWKSKEKVVALKKLNLLESEVRIALNKAHLNVCESGSTTGGFMYARTCVHAACVNMGFLRP